MRPTPRPFPLTSLAAACLALGCASPSGQLGHRLEAADAELRDQVGALQLAVDRAEDRDEDLADRLRQAEESLAALQETVRAQQERLDALGSPSPQSASGPGGEVASGPDGDFDASAAYTAAMESHRRRQFERAIAAFTQILVRAPSNSLADNARYWIGEAHYLQGEYRQALSEFAKVLAYRETEKADDAQLMIARTHLALGDQDQAAVAYRKLLADYPDSEYADVARQELRALESP